MIGTNRTFSEAWHRVADLRVGLRHSVSIRKQLYRGETCYILQDPFNNHFFRITPQAYQFVVRLQASRTVAEVWEESLHRNPEDAPGQDDVIELLAQLYQANLLSSDMPANSRKLFERQKLRRRKESRSKLLNLMFFRIPLFDPGRLLSRYQLIVSALTGRLAVAIWTLTTLFAVKAIIENFSQAANETAALLAFDNILLLYFGLVLVKSLHEAGHTLVCSRLGGEVHTVGIMLIVFAPLPYMDATSSWAFRDRWQRILVASSGMLFEFFAAACAALVWANTGPGVVHSLAFNMMVVASVSTLLFNLNPLLRFDGYYILSDLLEVPNLHQRAVEQLRFIVERYGFGNRLARPPTASGKESFWLTSYGISAGLYRAVVYIGIILFVADRFLLAGILMAALCIYTWAIVPFFRFVSFLYTSPELEKTRVRAIGVTMATGAILFIVLAIIPAPHRFSLPGIVEADHLAHVVNSTPGYVSETLTRNGARVSAGTPLLRLENPELELEVRVVKAQRDEIVARQQESFTLHGDTARKTLKKRLDALNAQLEKLLSDQQALTITAERSGIWVSPRDYEMAGAWLTRGTELGQIVADDSFHFTAVLSQEEAVNLFTEQNFRSVTVRLYGQGQADLPIKNHKIIPY